MVPVGAIGDFFAMFSDDMSRAVSSALIGSALGAVAAGWMSDRIGRRHSMAVAAVLFPTTAGVIRPGHGLRVVCDSGCDLLLSGALLHPRDQRQGAG